MSQGETLKIGLINTLFYLIIIQGVNGQVIRHEFTDPKDSVQLKGVRLFLEIDTLYQVTDTSGIKFNLELVNSGTEKVKVTNPLYDTELRINPNFWLLSTREKIKLKEVSRWPDPSLARNFKPFRLEKLTISGKDVPREEFGTYWETDTLELMPGQTIKYHLNLFERIIPDQKERLKMHFVPLQKGEYYANFNLSIRLNSKRILTIPKRFKMVLN